MASDQKKRTELEQLFIQVEQLICDVTHQDNTMKKNEKKEKLSEMLGKLSKNKDERFKQTMLEYIRDHLIAYQNHDLKKAQTISNDLLTQSTRNQRTKKALVWGIGIALCAIVLTLYILAWIFIAPIVMTVTMLAPAGPGGIIFITMGMEQMLSNIGAKHQQALDISTLLTAELSPDKNPDVAPESDSMERPNEVDHPQTLDTSIIPPTSIYPSLTDDSDEEALRAFEQEINAPLIVAAPHSSSEPIAPEITTPTNADSYNLYPSAPPDDDPTTNNSTRTAAAYGYHGLFNYPPNAQLSSHEIVYQPSDATYNNI